jgi:hypothetical protein
MTRRRYVECPRCGHSGADGPPGLRVSEYENLEAVVVDDQVLVGESLPIRVTCGACGHSWPMPRATRREKRPVS